MLQELLPGCPRALANLFGGPDSKKPEELVEKIWDEKMHEGWSW